MELTKYIPQRPPESGRDVARYLDAEIRKIQRALDSISAWKAQDFWVDIRDYGADVSLADNSGYINLAIAKAAADDKWLFIPAGVFLCTDDVPAIHTVEARGPGAIQVGTGRPWYAEPDSTNTSFSVPMTLYVSSTGNDDNSGIAPEFPLLTLPASADIVNALAPLIGFWRIIIAAGTYTDKAIFWGLQNIHAQAPLYISGPSVDAWDKTNEPSNVSDTGGNIPTAIFEGTGQGSGWAIDAQSRTHIIVEDIKFTDWGTKATDSDDGAIRAQNWSSCIAKNCHVWNSTTGVMGRENSYCQSEGGYYNNNRRFMFVIMARYQTGRGASSPGDTAATLIVSCTFGLDVWEEANGHNDYAHFRDNVLHCFIRKGGHSAMTGPTFERTTGTVVGVQVQDGGNINITSEVWTGTHSPRIKQYNFGADARELATNWRAPTFGTQTATADTTEHTVGSITIPRECFISSSNIPVALKFFAWGNLTNTNSTVTFRLKFDSTTILTCTLAANATTHNWKLDGFTIAVAANVQRSIMNLRRFDSTGGTDIQDDSILQTTHDFTAADVVVSMTVQCANASDSVSVSACVYECLGVGDI